MNRRAEPNRKLARIGVPKAKAEAFIKAVGAPQRRCILRILHDAGEAQSPNELAGTLGIAVGNISYHVKILKECGVLVLTDTRQRRGATEHFYASTVMDNELVAKLLEATKAEDE